MRSEIGRCIHTSWLMIGFMIAPPGCTVSLEGGEQICQGGRRQKGGLRDGFCGEVGSADGDVVLGSRGQQDEAMTRRTGEVGEAEERQGLAEQGMCRIGDRDLLRKNFLPQRGIRVG